MTRYDTGMRTIRTSIIATNISEHASRKRAQDLSDEFTKSKM